MWHILTLQLAMDERRPCDIEKKENHPYIVLILLTHTRAQYKERQEV